MHIGRRVGTSRPAVLRRWFVRHPVGRAGLSCDAIVRVRDDAWDTGHR
jgi:hypothetical protein